MFLCKPDGASTLSSVPHHRVPHYGKRSLEGYVSVKTLVCPGISGGFPGVPSVPSSPGPAIPGKKGELHYPAGLPPPSFLSSLCTWPEGEAGPGRHSPTFSFPVSVQGSFFSFLYSLPLPAPPSLSPLPPSLPSRLGRSAGVPNPLTAGTRRTPSRSRLCGAWSLPSPSLPPSPTPDAGSARRPEEPPR